MKKGLILFAHGARDPRWAEPFERLRDLVRGRMHEVPVELAYLELMSPSLGAAVQMHADAGCTLITIVPIFLGQGGHVRRDLPELIDDLRTIHPEIAIACAEAAGEESGVLAAIAAYCQAQLERDDLFEPRG